MKKLSERQAWLRLAKHFEIEETPRYGICTETAFLLDVGMISESVYMSMYEKSRMWAETSKVRWRDNKYAGWFAAPLDASGSRRRVSFCRKQAKLLTRKKVRP